MTGPVPRTHKVRNRPGWYWVAVGGVLVGRVARADDGGWVARPARCAEWLPVRHRTRAEAVGALVLIAERSVAA